MMRIPVLTVCAALAACDQSPDDRIAELDDAVTVDCGMQTNEYPAPATAQEMVDCMNGALAAGIRAKALVNFEIDFVSRFYTVDGAFVHLRGFSELDGEDHYTEWRCTTFEATEGTFMERAYAQVGATGCEQVREW
jgi:hypothetical protein